MQHSVIFAALPYGVGLDEVFLPQYLKEQGYQTHAIGKVVHWLLYGFISLNFFVCFQGMQHSVISAALPYGVGLDELFLPQYLKARGYQTHAIGKVELLYWLW